MAGDRHPGINSMPAGRMAGANLCRRRRMKDRRAITKRRRLRIRAANPQRTTRNAKYLCSAFTVAIVRIQATLEQQRSHGHGGYLQRPQHTGESGSSIVPKVSRIGLESSR